MRNTNFTLENCVGFNSNVELLQLQVNLTDHAVQRMSQRGIAKNDVELVMDYGKEIFAKGAVYYVIGKKEIKKYGKQEPRLKKLEGMRVITSTDDTKVITTYRNCKSRIPHV